MRKITAFFFVLLFLSPVSAQGNVKAPNVSGQFYSDNPTELSGSIDAFFAAATLKPWEKKIDMVIAPHAGYVYSGNVAAYSYKAASQGHYRTFIIIAPSHYVDFEGFSIWPEGGFTTPLGQVEVDSELSNKFLSSSDRIKSIPQVFEKEHSLEVQLPFLQKTFKDFKIVPILTGRPNLKDCQALALLLEKLIGGRSDVLVIVSSDMSHYFPDAIARKMDDNSLAAIKDLDINNFWTQSLMRVNMEMCGFPGVAVALFYAKAKGLKAEVLKYANSGDVTGDNSRVVGYSSVVFYKEGDEHMNKDNLTAVSLTMEQKKKLLAIARTTIENFIQTGKVAEFKESDPRLSFKEGAFVTIHKHGQLCGCIGNIIGSGPLYLTVRDMAVASATQDPRFSPVTKEELKDIDIEISVLSEPQRVTDVEKIKMGVHGVIVSRDAYHRGVFLPQVATETGWSKEEFLSQLCAQKAGLPVDAWKDPRVTLEIFTAQVFAENDAK